MDKYSLNPQEAYEEYKNLVYRLALARTGDIRDAEDILQEVFYKYIKRKPELESAEHSKAWFIKVTINCTKSLFNTSNRKINVPLEEELRTEDKELDTTLSVVLSLPQSYRTVIHLYYYEDYSVKDIARLLKCSENTVKTRLARGRERLKKALGSEIDV